MSEGSIGFDCGEEGSADAGVDDGPVGDRSVDGIVDGTVDGSVSVRSANGDRNTKTIVAS